MAESARVQNLEAIKSFREQYAKILSSAARNIEETAMAFKKFKHWIESDLPPELKIQGRKLQEKYALAKNELSSAKMLAGEKGGSFIDERRRLEKAQRNLDEVQLKVKQLRIAIGELEKIDQLFTGRCGSLSSSLSSGTYSQSLHRLDRILTQLEEYQALGGV